MDEVAAIFIATFAVLIFLSPAIFCYRTAKANGMPALRWFMAGLLFNIFAMYDIYSATSQVFTCPACEAEFVAGEPQCPNCHKRLPDRYSLMTIVQTEKQFDGECPACATPYFLEDYRHTALEVRCSRCNEVLERR
jgi:predicted Zn finger-like uncharacterized protein